MGVRKIILTILLIALIGTGAWAGLLYRTYGWQTTQYLLRSTPEIAWTYTKAIFNQQESTTTIPDGKGGYLKTELLNRPRPSLPLIAAKHLIASMSHAYQKLNNCGPVSASMAASTLGVTFDQFYAAERLKGGPADKNVGPYELVPFLEAQGLKAVYRINGNAAIVEQLVSRDIPVIAEQWLVKRGTGELVGHYRVVRGYDQNTKLFTTNDSFNGPNFVIPYSQFDEWWRPFNRTYIVVYKSEQENVVKEILAADWDQTLNAQGAVAAAEAETETVGDGYSYFNLGSAHTSLRDYTKAKGAYDKAFTQTFPEHFLWYEYGPLEAYYQTGEYERVLQLTDDLLRAAGNMEEAHYYRALALEKQGKTSEAEAERVKTLEANANFIPPFK